MELKDIIIFLRVPFVDLLVGMKYDIIMFSFGLYHLKVTITVFHFWIAAALGSPTRCAKRHSVRCHLQPHH